MRRPPYPTVLKPYGSTLLELARSDERIVCLSGDLTRQCEVDLFRDELPERFVNVGMAEANMMGIAGALAREGLVPFAHTFGVFATRRPFDQIVNAIAYPNLPVRIVGFMPGVSSPGGPSHQAIEDVALMRALPNLTVIDAADATEIRQVVPAIVDHPGPVYLRLKRGEIPVIFDSEYEFRLDRATRLREGAEAVVIANGMMLPAAIAATDLLVAAGVDCALVHVPVVKPLDTATVVAAVVGTRAVVTAENHTIIGGLGSAVAEAMAEAGLGSRLRRVGLRDTFAEGALTAHHLFEAYHLRTQSIVDAAWSALDRTGPAPEAPSGRPVAGEYSPV
ncbi:transketolase C-terminal domain-containing protein [Solwaraspora sp. WMMD1047]|uniref:transketolase family protein n=1 Tax=Solwaraspora sp. WMMD1047 TaxID=3016102 RepID=UPI002417BA58|nr:transketolase C-terminal domain-containing protein [Solwaraspora sp. WMMD1047]MDG4830561.1 transketolase C-terminal domain-containing protein [Solwaraspora sp. WMMD1047]